MVDVGTLLEELLEDTEGVPVDAQHWDVAAHVSRRCPCAAVRDRRTVSCILHDKRHDNVKSVTEAVGDDVREGTGSALALDGDAPLHVVFFNRTLNEAKV